MPNNSNRDLEDYFTILMLTAGSDSQVEELRALWDRFLKDIGRK